MDTSRQERKLISDFPLVAKELRDKADLSTLAGAHKKVWWVCDKNHEWEAVVKNRTYLNSGCPYCTNKKVLTGYNDLATVRPDLAQQWDYSRNEETPENVYHATYRKFWWVDTLGHSWIQSLQKRSNRGDGCPYCAKSGGKLLKGFNDLATVRPDLAEEWSEGNALLADEVYPNDVRGFEWVGECGHKWVTSPANRNANGTGCPYCASNPKVLTGYNDLATLYPHLVNEWDFSKNKLTPSEVYATSNARYWWVCDRGHEWAAAVSTRSKAGAQCRRCTNNGFSRMEEELHESIQSLGLVTRQHDKSIASGYEYDITIPDKRIAIEFNGVYWHSSKFKAIDYHLKKMQACREAGWTLLQVWEDEWVDKRPIIERMLARKLGVSKEPKVNARDLAFGIVSSKEANEFLEANHIQGASGGSWRGGLYDNGVLVAVMLMKHRGDGLWELTRFTTSCIVRGGHSRLLKKFISEIKPKQVVTFSDNCVSDGSLYENAGFRLDKELMPDYKYLVKYKRVHKFHYRVERFKSDPNLEYREGLSEKQLAELNRLYRVYDAGKKRWLLTL